MPMNFGMNRLCCIDPQGLMSVLIGPRRTQAQEHLPKASARVHKLCSFASQEVGDID
jgi:hypothetical protein